MKFQISPKAHQIVAMIVAVLTVLAQGSVKAPVGIPPEWAAWFVSWDNFLLAIYAVAAPFMLISGDDKPGFFTSPPVAKAISDAPKVVAFIALAFVALHVGAARAADHPLALARNQTPAEFNSGTAGAGTASTQAGAASALSGAFGDIINFFATDFDDAAKLATEIPSLQDNNGAACWRQMSSIGVLLKAHPLPLTLKAATDFEALRLLSMSINQACANPACTQVFTDLSNGIAQIGVGIPVPSLTSICAKVPTITPGPALPTASAAPPASPAPAAN